MVEKKSRAKPLSLYPMSFEEAVRRAIEAGPYLGGKEFDEYKGIAKLKAKSRPRAAAKPVRRTSPTARKSAKPTARSARGR